MTTDRRLAFPAILAAIGVILALAGCAPAVGVQSPTGSPMHDTPQATSSPAPTLPVWSGECALFFTDAQSQAVTAHLTVLQPAGGFLAAFDQVTTLAGGHDCSYSDAESDIEHVNLAIFPASLPTAAASAPKCANANSGPVQPQDVCSAAAVANGYWMTIDFAPGSPLSYAQAFSAVNAIISTFTTKTAAYAAPVAPVATPGTWVKTETCDALASHSGAAGAIGYSGFAHATDPIYVANGPGYVAAQTRVGAIGCQWGSQSGVAASGKISGFEVYLVPGGGALNPAAAVPPNSTAVSIPGASAAWDVEYNGNNVVNVFVVSGPNYLEFTPNGGSAVDLAAIAPAITTIITTMNAGG